MRFCAGYLTLGLGKTFHESGGAWNANAYWSTDVLPYFTYSSNHCPHGGAGGGHCILPDDKVRRNKNALSLSLSPSLFLSLSLSLLFEN
jgi:hypothetical protein